MKEVQDKLIAALHDGELDVAAQHEAKRLMLRDEQAKAFFDQLQATDRAVRSAYDPVLESPIPPAMLELVAKSRRRRISSIAIPLALAASLVLVAVLMVRQVTSDAQMRQQFVDMQRQIAELRYKTLENVPSGTAASWVAPVGAARAEILPLRTYRTSDNRFCREYEERLEDKGGIEVRRGIACREGKSQWPDVEASSPSVMQPHGERRGKSVNL